MLCPTFTDNYPNTQGLVNSPFVTQWFSDYPREGNHLRLIDRARNEGASPHTWVMEDWDTIVHCPYFWARKFDVLRDDGIIEKVVQTWP